MGNPEPVFASSRTELTAPPKILKEKHIKLKLRAGQPLHHIESEPEELTTAAILTTARCHPDGAAIRRSEKKAASTEGYDVPQDENSELRRKVSFDALGWNMAERLSKVSASRRRPGQYRVYHREQRSSEYGGLELSLRDFKPVASQSNSVARSLRASFLPPASRP